MSRGLGCSIFWRLICAQTAQCGTLKFRSEKKVEDHQNCESTRNYGEYQVPMCQGFLRKCSFLDVSQCVCREIFALLQDDLSVGQVR